MGSSTLLVNRHIRTWILQLFTWMIEYCSGLTFFLMMILVYYSPSHTPSLNFVRKLLIDKFSSRMRSFFGEHLSTSVPCHVFLCWDLCTIVAAKGTPAVLKLLCQRLCPVSWSLIFTLLQILIICFDHDDRKNCSADGHSWHHVHQSSAGPKALLKNCLPYSVFVPSKNRVNGYASPSDSRSLQPYSSTCIGGEAPDCQEAQEDGDRPMV